MPPRVVVRSSAPCPPGLAAALPTYEPGQTLATRDASGQTIQALAAAMPELWGGSADLAEPNRTTISGGASFLPEEASGTGRAGRNVHWGVREHAMASAMNGIALVGGSRFFAGTFLVFSDYQRPAIRLAALMQVPVTYLWSHDSVALGADGPTHQPIEHLASLRAIPGFAVVRPADAAETAAAWLAVLEKDAPAGLVLARQPLPVAATPAADVLEGVRRGGYVVQPAAHPPDPGARRGRRATGSEVALALEAVAAAPELDVRVVSMPSREWFAAQSRGVSRVGAAAGYPRPGRRRGRDRFRLGGRRRGERRHGRHRGVRPVGPGRRCAARTRHDRRACRRGDADGRGPGLTLSAATR